jgi:hypothetical protein
LITSAKRLLQQYLPLADIANTLRGPAEGDKPETLRDVTGPSVYSAGSRQFRDFPDMRDRSACSGSLGQ